MRLTWIPGDDNNSPITGQPGPAPTSRGVQLGGPTASSLGVYSGLSTEWRPWSVSCSVFGRSSCASVSHGRLSALLGTPRAHLGKELTDSAPQTVPPSLPPQTTLSSLKKTSSSQGSGTTIPSSRAVSTQLCSGCHPTSITSSGSSPSTRWAAATPASRLSATEPAEHVSA